MATKIYDSGYITLIDGTKLYITPLKIKYLRQFMDTFEFVKLSRDNEEANKMLSLCALVCMQQYSPNIKTIDHLEDSLDMENLYLLLDYSAGIKLNKTDDDKVEETSSSSGQTWDKIDLASLESEAFLLGIWKDYEDLEASMSMPELMATLTHKRDSDYQDKKFLAAIQGVDLDKQSGRAKEPDAWEKLKARVFSKGKTDNPRDILALQGQNAINAGFGIGMGLTHEVIKG